MNNGNGEYVFRFTHGRAIPCGVHCRGEMDSRQYRLVVTGGPRGLVDVRNIAAHYPPFPVGDINNHRGNNENRDTWRHCRRLV